MFLLMIQRLYLYGKSLNANYFTLFTFLNRLFAYSIPIFAAHENASLVSRAHRVGNFGAFANHRFFAGVIFSELNADALGSNPEKEGGR